MWKIAAAAYLRRRFHQSLEQEQDKCSDLDQDTSSSSDTDTDVDTNPEIEPSSRQQLLDPASPFKLSPLRLFSAVGLFCSVVFAVVSVGERQQPVLTTPRLTYGTWLARRPPSEAREPPLKFAGRLVRFNTTDWVHVRWPYNAECRRHVVRFARRGQLPPAALVALPGGGATWLRGLIEDATGVFTAGSHYNTELYNIGFYGQLLRDADGSTVAQHSVYGPSLSEFRAGAAGEPSAMSQGTLPGRSRGSELPPEDALGKTILLLRDPYKVLLEGRGAETGAGGSQQEQSFSDRDWDKFVRLKLQQWVLQVQLTTELAQQLLVLHFEDMLEHSARELDRVLSFLQLEAPAERLRCAAAAAPPAAGPVSERMFQDPELRQLVDQRIDEVAELLRQRGHLLPLTKYTWYRVPAA